MENDYRNENIETLVSATECLTQALHMLATMELTRGLPPLDVSRGIDFYREITQFETDLIIEALRISDGSQVHAAALLGMNYTTLNCKIKKYGIDLKLLNPAIPKDTFVLSLAEGANTDSDSSPELA